MRILLAILLSTILTGLTLIFLIFPKFPSLTESKNDFFLYLIFFVIYGLFLFIFTVIFSRRK
jgi:hypothetical protein